MDLRDDGSRSLYFVFIGCLEMEGCYEESLRLCKLCAEALHVGESVRQLINVSSLAQLLATPKITQVARLGQ